MNKERNKKGRIQTYRVLCFQEAKLKKRLCCRPVARVFSYHLQYQLRLQRNMTKQSVF